MYSNAAFYNVLLEMVKIINLKQNNELCAYFVVPSSVRSLSEFAEEIGNDFKYLIPLECTREILPKLELGGIAEIKHNGFIYSFELLSGAQFNEKYVNRN